MSAIELCKHYLKLMNTAEYFEAVSQIRMKNKNEVLDRMRTYLAAEKFDLNHSVVINNTPLNLNDLIDPPLDEPISLEGILLNEVLFSILDKSLFRRWKHKKVSHTDEIVETAFAKFDTYRYSEFYKMDVLGAMYIASECIKGYFEEVRKQ